MKKSQLKRFLTDYITDNKVQLIVAVLSVFVGTVIGSLSAVFLENAEYNTLGVYIDNFVSAYNLQPVNRSEIFIHSLYNNFKIILFMWLSGIWVGFIPLCCLQLGAKGYKIGFTVTALVRILGTKGILFVGVSLLPQLLIGLPILIAYAVFNTNSALMFNRIRNHAKTKISKKELYIKNFLCLLGTVLIMVFCSFFDSFVIPPVLKPVCSMLSKQ